MTSHGVTVMLGWALLMVLTRAELTSGTSHKGHASSGLSMHHGPEGAKKKKKRFSNGFGWRAGARVSSNWVTFAP